MQIRFAAGLLLIVCLTGTGEAAAQSPWSGAVEALVKSYPEFLNRIEGNELVWKDGARMQIDDGKGEKPFEALLDDPDIKDMFSMVYPAGEKGIPPGVNFDPGRVRYAPLFKKMYGDCSEGGVTGNLVNVNWLPHQFGNPVKFSRVNGAAAALQKVSDELDKLPRRFLTYLRPTQGTYNCRAIAGTSRQSAHGFGVAIDIAAKHTHYWRWAAKPKPGAPIPYRNEVPWDIVRVFERHGFIWGGKWYHYDTMHFEYRPEIIATAK